MLPALPRTCMRRLLLSLLSLAALSAPLFAANPNIVLIYGDDIGYGDLSCNGATAVKTPHVDRLAREALRLTSAYATSATCTPSRYSLLTGEYAFRKLGTGVLPGDAAFRSPTRRALTTAKRNGFPEAELASGRATIWRRRRATAGSVGAAALLDRPGLTPRARTSAYA